MKIAMTAAALGVIGLLGVAVPAAQAIEFDVGPGGVHVDRDYRYHRGPYAESGCRTIITHRTNRFGEDVTVRRRVCD